jgi:hypothetical protein
MLMVSPDEPFGNLIAYQSRVFDPNHGLVDVAEDLVAEHNRVLDEATINGLDDLCEVGQGGSFYHHAGETPEVRTFTGIVVSDDVTVKGRSITFRRKGKTFRGRLIKNSEAFYFHRTQ